MIDGFSVQEKPQPLTAAIIAYMQAGEERGDAQCAGLRVRCLASGLKVFFYRYRARDGARLAQRQATYTLENLVNEYINEVLKGQKRGAESARILRQDLLPVLGHRPALQITRRELQDEVIRPKMAKAPQVRRKRVLSDAELAKFLEWLPHSPYSRTT